MSKLYSMSL